MSEIHIYDALVFRDGQNPMFRSWTTPDAQGDIHLMENEPFQRLEERPIPQDVKDGLSRIEHVTVPHAMIDGRSYNLN